MATTAFGAVVYAGILWAAVRSQLRALGLGLSTKVARPPAGVAPLRCAERTRLAAALEARLTNPFIMVTGPTVRCRGAMLCATNAHAALASLTRRPVNAAFAGRR